MFDMWLLILFFLMGSSKVFAQNEKLVSIELTDVPFSKFVQEMESRLPCRFYFNAAEIDSLRITLKAENENISSILQKALRGSNFLFSIDV